MRLGWSPPARLGRFPVLPVAAFRIPAAVALAACLACTGAGPGESGGGADGEEPLPAVHGGGPTGGVNAPRHRDAPHVVLVSLDGFRHDFRALHRTPNLDRLAARGVAAEWLIPTFPTKTFPVHYSIATGLYPENHGLVGNRFRDPARRALYDMRDREAVEDGTWYRGEPIWVTAKKQGMVAAAYFWVGTEADVAGVRPTHWRRFDADVPGSVRVDRVLAWLSEPEETRPHLVTLYFEHVDAAAHEHGPRSPETGAAVEAADALIGRLLDGIDGLPHGRSVYLIVVSDHGHAEWTAERAARLRVARYPGVEMVEGGPYASFVVHEGGPERLPALRDSIQEELGGSVRVYRRRDVPERFHYRADPRIGDLVAIADPGVLIVPASWSPERSRGSSHGWDNAAEEMGGVFLATGPRLPGGRVIPPLEAVDVHPFVARVLGLDTPPVDGSAETLGELLAAGGATSPPYRLPLLRRR